MGGQGLRAAYERAPAGAFENLLRGADGAEARGAGGGGGAARLPGAVHTNDITLLRRPSVFTLAIVWESVQARLASVPLVLHWAGLFAVNIVLGWSSGLILLLLFRKARGQCPYLWGHIGWEAADLGELGREGRRQHEPRLSAQYYMLWIFLHAVEFALLRRRA